MEIVQKGLQALHLLGLSPVRRLLQDRVVALLDVVQKVDRVLAWL